MRGKRPLYSRRRRALRWIAAAALLMLVNQWLNLYCLTMSQALRRAEKTYGIGPTEIWTRLDTPQAEDESLRHWLLSWSQDEILLSTVRFNFRTGWNCKPVTLLREDGAPISAGFGEYCNETQAGYETGYLFFGSIRDPSITEVEVSAYHESLSEMGGGITWIRSPEQQVRVSNTDFVTLGERRAFLVMLPLVADPGGSTTFIHAVTGFRSEGESVPVENLSHGIQRQAFS